MMKDWPKRADIDPAGLKLPDDFRALTHSILHCANRGEPRTDFMREVSRLLLDFSGCDLVKIIFREGQNYSCWVTKRDQANSFQFEIAPCPIGHDGTVDTTAKDHSVVDRICQDVIRGQVEPSLPFFTRYGSFWIGDSRSPLSFQSYGSVGSETAGQVRYQGLLIGGDYGSLALIPIIVANEIVGVLQLHSRERSFFSEYEIGLYEAVTQTFGVALVNQRAQAALRERIKELTCLYGIATLAERPDITMEEILQGIANLLPPAWQYPEITHGRIVLDGRSYISAGFMKGVSSQTSDIEVNGAQRGMVEVVYTESKPELDEGPFLKEERKLINAVATQIAILMERRQAEQEKARLQDQLRHADRLATLGQLAAGVAHELNEPLGSILGFAQLAKKTLTLPEQTAQDIEKIINASLHAREVVKKLMLFSRQMPTRKTRVDLNKMVKEGLYFLESRCAKSGIEMIRTLSPDIPEIIADPSQLYQVLVNLAVNSVQAMPQGGKLTISTKANDGYVSLIVEDTGVGIRPEIMKDIFTPFFTTKDVNEGTGLGLAVVHGIVTSHGGRIKVESEPGHGSRFEISLPVIGTNSAEKGEQDD